MENFSFRTQRLTIKMKVVPVLAKNISCFSYYRKSFDILFTSVWNGAHSGLSSSPRGHTIVVLQEMDSLQNISIIVCISSMVVSIQVLFVILRNILNVVCDCLFLTFQEYRHCYLYSWPLIHYISLFHSFLLSPYSL